MTSSAEALAKNKLYGHSGHDILIGGTGEDKLKGGRGDDLLIGGSAAKENDLASLDAALAGWVGGNLTSASVTDLGTLTDDEDEDDLKGENDFDHLIGGVWRRLQRLKADAYRIMSPDSTYASPESWFSDALSPTAGVTLARVVNAALLGVNDDSNAPRIRCRNQITIS